MLGMEDQQASNGSSTRTTPRQQVLIIEDDGALVKLLRTALEFADYEVHVVRCGTTALTYAADSRPDLVILDLGLPDMNGYDVCRKLHQPPAGAPPPILILSGLSGPADQQLGFECGAAAYLTKPADLSELCRTVQLLLQNAAAGSPTELQDPLSPKDS